MKNITAIKVKFLPVTDTQPMRIKFIQTNNNKSTIINQVCNETPFDYVNIILESCETIKSCFRVIDSTQNKYSLFAVDTVSETIFGNVIEEIKARYK